MAKSYPDQVEPGAFVSTTNRWDVSQIFEFSPDSDEFKQLIVELFQNINDIALVLNIKDSGYYVPTEFVNGQIFFPNPALSSTTSDSPVYRQVFRKVINFGTLPNAGTTSVAHGLTIDSNFTFTRIYGAATDPSTTFIPLPYSSTTLVNNIELSVDTTNVNITTGIDRTGFTITYIILEYIKQ